jgi:membrane protease YdiL (CAAX protease family)
MVWDSKAHSMFYLTGYFAFLIVAWVGAWYLHDVTFVRDLGPGATVAYWTLAKVIVWIAPILLIVTRALKRPAVAYLGLTGFARGIRVGSVVGATLVLLSAMVDAVTRTHAVPGPTWGMLNALAVAPLFEEVMFRGFALKVLDDSGYRFWPANTIAATLFLGLHLPGWYFMGTLGLSQVVLGLTIVIVGLVAGYAKGRSNSTWASVTVHFFNNLYAAFVR